ncbi:MAG: efflux RND transporter periplasmic adaptor subunit, partial [Pseudomonadota bacterium]|nr:efflux RND transporter periplasmic adaptor subunit [Pseudomonadota bacterium]
MTETVKLSVIASVGVFVWLISGFLVPSGPALEVPSSISEKSNIAETVKVVSKEIFPEDFNEILSIRGYTKAKRSVSIASETSGIIDALPAKEGQKVKKNELICKIRVGAREAKLAEAEALMRAKEIDFKAAEKLVEKGHFSLSRAAAAQAAFDTAKALVAQRQIELERTMIRAPFDGVLDVRHVELGDFITIGQPCGTVIDKNPLKVVTQVSEKQVSSLKTGAQGKATLATGEVVEGVISYLAEKADPVTRTFRMEVEVDNSDYLLRDGVSTNLEV